MGLEGRMMHRKYMQRRCTTIEGKGVAQEVNARGDVQQVKARAIYKNDACGVKGLREW